MKKLLFIGCALIGVLGAANPTWAGDIDSLVCFKSRRTLILYSNGVEFKTYKVSLGKTPVGAKEIEGDKKTPEGRYMITGKDNGDYHKKLDVNYPNKQDVIRGRAGSNIKIHGLKNGLGWLGKLHRLKDWTIGCIAVTNKEIDEIYSLVGINTLIFIYP